LITGQENIAVGIAYEGHAFILNRSASLCTPTKF